jgi:hypothetical protein
MGSFLWINSLLGSDQQTVLGDFMEPAVDQVQAVEVTFLCVIPAKAGIQLRGKFWIPAFAGMTRKLRK